jgi:hypothetical protein
MEEADVEWLRNASSERFGHQHFRRFQRSRNWILQNPDIVSLWKFAVQLNDTSQEEKWSLCESQCDVEHTQLIVDLRIHTGQLYLEMAHLCSTQCGRDVASAS